MSMIIPPILPNWGTDLLMSFISIGYGMVWECNFTPWVSVVMNTLMTLVFLGSNYLPLLVVPILVVFVLIGVAVAKYDVKKAYSVFGTKTFGALTLTAFLGSFGFLNWLVSVLNPISSFFQLDYIYLITWLIIGLLIHLLGYHFFRSKK